MGLNVVRTNVEKLKGQVQVTSRLGTGARFVISLPLTLATIQALLIRCAGEVFAVPMFSVAKTLHLAREAITLIEGNPAIVEDEEVIPVRSLATALGWQEDEGARLSARLMLQRSASERGWRLRGGQAVMLLHPIEPVGIGQPVVPDEELQVFPDLRRRHTIEETFIHNITPVRFSGKGGSGWTAPTSSGRPLG
jgi:two-component system chemotaxis sensor kinase CheA